MPAGETRAGFFVPRICAPNMRKLTNKQRRFVDEYLIDMNASAAARRAGYSEKTCTKIGPQLLGKTRVAEEIAKAIERRSAKTGVDASWVLRRLADEAEADVADLYYEYGQLKPVHEWPKIWRQGLVAGVDIEYVGDGDVVTIKKLRLSDRAKRLEMLGKHVDVQAFKERVEHSGQVDIAQTILSARKRVGRE